VLLGWFFWEPDQPMNFEYIVLLSSSSIPRMIFPRCFHKSKARIFLPVLASIFPDDGTDDTPDFEGAQGPDEFVLGVGGFEAHAGVVADIVL